MHVELALVLESALRKLYPESVLERFVSQTAARHFLLQVLDVDDCPDHVRGSITSSIAFKAAKELNVQQRTDSGPPVNPVEIAERIKAEISNQEPGFLIEIGGGGHLNIQPSPAFAARWTARVSHAGPEVFFSMASAFSDDPLSVEHFPIDWPACAERLARRKDPELLELLNQAHADSLSAERKLMLLGILADPELDPRPYFSGLSGNQNLPWYFRRYLDDTERFLVLAHKREDFDSAGQGPTEKIPADAEQLVRSLLHFRRSFFWGSVTAKPEELMRELLSITRAFYRMFHQPRYRALSQADVPAADLRILAGLCGLSGKLIAASLTSFSLKEILRTRPIEFNDR